MQKLLSNSIFRNVAGLIISITLIIGFLTARAIHSISLIGVGLMWVAYYKNAVWLWKDKWFLSLFAVILCVPFFDIINDNQIHSGFFLKLSLPLYVLFFFSWNPDKKYIGYLHKSIFIILFLLAMEAITRYLTNTDSINRDYEAAKVLSIGHYSDHIRISVFIALSCVFALYELNYNSKSKIYKNLLIAYIIFQSIFLHFLSARTGLVVFYISIFTYLLHLIIKRKSLLGYGLVIIIAALPFISMEVFPSFYNRMGYTFWDKGFYEKMEYREGSSDGFRVYSMVAGIDIFKKNWKHGVGFNNLKNESHSWLKNKFPNIKDSELIQPSSQFLIYAASGGILGLLTFIAFAFIPIFDGRLLKNEIFISVYLGILATFIFEIFLENQYGTFVFGFCVYWVYFLAKREELNIQ